ncbi:MAG: VOC family protein [Paracoccaceae bacterium]
MPELDVTDLDVSLQFWCELLGFNVAYSRPAARFAYLQRENIQIMLCQINGEWVTGQLEAPFGRGINFQMTVADIDHVVATLEKHAWPLFRPAQEKTYKVGGRLSMSREFLVQDPDGYLIRFAQNC